MRFYFYGPDSYYTLFIIIPAIIISLIAQIKVKSTFSKYSKYQNSLRITGAEAARQVLEANGVSGVKIERVSGNLTDHFDPRTNVIRLSDSVYDSSSVAAVGVAAHEAGHAVQYAENYAPIKIRNSGICPLKHSLRQQRIQVRSLCKSEGIAQFVPNQMIHVQHLIFYLTF